jgi:hypothetical protein
MSNIVQSGLQKVCKGLQKDCKWIAEDCKKIASVVMPHKNQSLWQS